MLDLGVSPEKGVELIDEIWNPHCVPEWSFDELNVIMGNAVRYMQNEPGAHAVRSGEEVFGETVRKLYQAKQEEEAGKPLIYIRDRETQLNSPSPEMQIETILPARKVVMVTGERGNGKTYVALEILNCVICM